MSRLPFAQALARRRAQRRAHRARIAAQLGYFRAVLDQCAPGASPFEVPDAAARAAAQVTRAEPYNPHEWRRREAAAEGGPEPTPHGAHLDTLERGEPGNFAILRALRHQLAATAEHVAFHVRAAPWLPGDARRAARAFAVQDAAARAAAEAAGAAAIVGGAAAVATGPMSAGAVAAAKTIAAQVTTDGLKAGGKEVLKGPLRAAGSVLRPGAHAAAALEATVAAVDALIIHADGPIARAWAAGERMDLAIRRLMRHATAEIERIVDAWAGAENPRYVRGEAFGPLPALAVNDKLRWTWGEHLTQKSVGFTLAIVGLTSGGDWADYIRRVGILLYDPGAESMVLRDLDSLRIGEPEAAIRPLLEHPDPAIRRRTRERIGRARPDSKATRRGR